MYLTRNSTDAKEAVKMTEQQFLETLRKHDWTYHYSDDSRVYHKGLAMDQFIQVSMKGRRDLQKLYDDFRNGITH